jgi:hypothetical protein
MNSGSSLPYRLRPNKSVDREMFLSLLTRLMPSMSIEKYHYIGLGGPFLEDFRLLHARLGIVHMTCVEIEKEVHKRQLFNRPVPSIECVHSQLEEYLDKSDFEKPVIIWFDYTDPRKIYTQIQRFSQAIGEVPLDSVLRITLNASPESLGTPKINEISVEFDDDVTVDRLQKPTIHEWRLERFRERIKTIFPSGLSSEDMTHRNFGRTLLRVLKIAVEREALNFNDRKIIWCLATHYKDGQSMVTATIVVCRKEEFNAEELIKSWEFYSTAEAPHCIDLPALSTLERLIMESNENIFEKLGFNLPGSEFGLDPVAVFKRYYRIYPHFSRIEL